MSVSAPANTKNLRRRRSGVVVPNQPNIAQRVLSRVIGIMVRSVCRTLRTRYVDRSGLLEGSNPGPAIYCVWHNRLAVCLMGYREYVQPRNHTAGMAALVSASKDGALLAAILEDFGVEPVRGSTSRRGPQAMLELTTWAERGYDLAITPDGPRGPRYQVQEGVMWLAQVTGLPIVAASFNLSGKIQAKSWDRFQIPLPFAACEVILGEAIRVPRDATDAEREQLRCRLQRTLAEITHD